MNETNEPAPIHHVPRARHAFDAKMHDGAMIHIRQHGNPGAPRLVLSHGNGLAIDGYFPFWGPLRERYEVVVFDFRNHGHNPLHTAEGHTWQNFIADMDIVWHAINRELGAKPAAGLFHSLSGVTDSPHWCSSIRRSLRAKAIRFSTCSNPTRNRSPRARRGVPSATKIRWNSRSSSGGASKDGCPMHTN